MTKRRRAILLIAAALAAGGGLYYFYFYPEYPDFLPGRAAERDTALALYGNIDIREVDLAFNTTGKIERMLVEEGDAVTRGQLLAALDANRYRARLDAARATAAARKAVLDRLLAGSRPEEIRKARADVRAIAAELADARSDLARVTKLAKDQFASQQRLDSARANVAALKARLKAAKEVLALAVAGPRAEDIAEARARYRSAQAEAALIAEEIKDTRLYASDDGIVRTRILEPGAVVLPNSPVYTISLVDPVWVRTYVSEPDLGRVRPGMKARIYTDSAPDRPYDGWVGFISPVAEFTPKTVESPRLRTSLVYRIRVFVHNRDRALRQGMPVTVRLSPETAAAAGGT